MRSIFSFRVFGDLLLINLFKHQLHLYRCTYQLFLNWVKIDVSKGKLLESEGILTYLFSSSHSRNLFLKLMSVAFLNPNLIILNQRRIVYFEIEIALINWEYNVLDILNVFCLNPSIYLNFDWLLSDLNHSEVNRICPKKHVFTRNLRERECEWDSSNVSI
jgi:hypothetical protein